MSLVVTSVSDNMARLLQALWASALLARNEPHMKLMQSKEVKVRRKKTSSARNERSNGCYIYKSAKNVTTFMAD